MFVVIVLGPQGPVACYHGFKTREEAKQWGQTEIPGFSCQVLRSLHKDND